MTSYPKLPIARFLMVIFAFALTTSLQAQSSNENSDKDQTVAEQHELIKYEKTYTLQKEENEESFGLTLTGIERRSPDDVFLAQNTAVPQPGELQKAEEPVEKIGFDEVYASSGSFSENEVSFSNSGDSSEGSGISFTGSSGPGCNAPNF